MPFIGRYTRYPLYPQFGADPTQFQNIQALLIERDNFLVGTTLELQYKVGSNEVRLYDQLVEFYNGEIDFTVLEGVTVTDGVTPVPIGNPDRNSVFVSSVQAFSDPTGISGGVVIPALEHFGIDAPVTGLGDIPPQNVNYITLKFNSNYIFRFTNVGTETIIDFRYIMLWAE